MSLFAPLRVAVEIRAPDRRVFRLSSAVAETGLRLARPAPYEVGRPVTVRFALAPRDPTEPEVWVTTTATVGLTDEDGDGETGGRALAFVEPTRDSRQAVARYVADRLGLTPPG